jgi:hypothetical protein
MLGDKRNTRQGNANLRGDDGIIAIIRSLGTTDVRDGTEV